MRAFLLCLCLMTALPARPWASQPAQVCEMAARQAAAETGVPFDILAALTLTETGRRVDGIVRPWAWSANAEGAGHWFDDPGSAIDFVQGRVAQGRPNVDIGCFQINYRWHGEHFRSVTHMFDPLENARYAAQFVGELYLETGDWRRAAGAFHSRTPVHADRYLARFDTLRAMLRDRGFQGMADSPETYNSFAALPSGTRRAAGLRERVTLLGAPVGTAPQGQGGSLAVLGGARGRIAAAPGPVIAARAAGPVGGAPAGSLWRGP